MPPGYAPEGTNGALTTAPPITVLLADDQPIARLGTRSVLDPLPDIDVVGEAASGPEAVHRAETEAPDLIVVELKMAHLSGPELVRALNEACPTMKILVFSAYNEPEYVAELLDGRVAGYLTKQDASGQLVEAVHGVARGDTEWVSPRVARTLMSLQRQRRELDACRLTEREQEALRALATGAPNSEIADRLCISIGTIKNHLTNVYEKLGVRTRSEAIVWAHAHGLL
jgi:DNA-binding NarL/FixJ family response regulator